ncbi:hypothetical protein BG011_010224 [Mortierella polycephala]|uniref:OTU domain-containing protein n=1 Tax=Mortierella polycephala TaxID=41804 RepID=A0A9P6PJW0_9FUNG|nr:hypothetical protein BG011_010224 [Mortierella polycephala]
MAPVKTRSTSSKYNSGNNNNRGYKADPEDTNDDDDFYGIRELKHQLSGLNLQLKDTTGDGNCLFRACADQYYGSESNHSSLRTEVCRYIEGHAEHFKSFLDNVTVDAHVSQMRKNGTYGGNIELVAFARMKKVDIKVYQPGYIFVIEGVDVKKEGSSPGQRPVMHIAYHSWEHYSSIRNIDGPHEGLPEINPRLIRQKPLAKLTSRDPPRSIERMIMSISGVQDLDLVRELLEKYHGNVDSVYNDLAEKSFAEANPESDSETLDDSNTQDLVKDGKEQMDDTAKKQLPGEPSEGKNNMDAEGADADKSGAQLNNKDGVSSLGKATNPPSPTSFTDTDPSVSTTSKPSFRAPTPVSTVLRATSPAVSSADSSHHHLKDQSATSSSPSSLLSPFSKASDEPAKGVIPKKRISARERKELAKRNQKLNRKNKGKPGFNANGSGSSSSSEHSLIEPSAKASKSSGNMRELFV